MTDRPNPLLALPGRQAAAPLPVAPGNEPGGAPLSVDPLADVLRAVRLQGALFFLADVAPPWVGDIPPAHTFAPIVMPGAQQIISYHIVTAGHCWGWLAGGAPIRLESGDILVIPHGHAYAIASAPGMRAEPAQALDFFRLMAAGRLPFRVAEGGGGRDAFHLVCGFLGCDRHPFNPVLAALPPLMHLRAPADQVEDRLGHLIEFALAESRQRQAGGRCVVLALAELMFVEAIRRHLAMLPVEHTGWLAALRDPLVGRALALLHERPGDPWSLGGLASRVGAARSTLTDRFTCLVGLAPMQYLARWRMQLAARMLRDEAKVCAVALDVGYESEAAFSRAFKRIVGVPPSAWRGRGSASIGGEGKRR